MPDSLWPHGLQHSRFPCLSPTPRVCSHSCPLSQLCLPTISSSVLPFSSCPQFFPASKSFPMSWFFTSEGQSIGASVSASVLQMNIQGWFPLGLTGLISLQFKGLLRIFSDTTCIGEACNTFAIKIKDFKILHIIYTDYVITYEPINMFLWRYIHPFRLFLPLGWYW